MYALDNPNYEKVDIVPQQHYDNAAGQQQQQHKPVATVSPVKNTEQPDARKMDSRRRGGKKQQKSPSSGDKSTTLPRHFKQSMMWKKDARSEQERLIQEQLNAERDEEIVELQRKFDQLSTLQKDRCVLTSRKI